uniref:Uncharacterized protein n=1 Tax=Oryza nivara TaxID=4536 RepID=A0A0E0GP39_ORYNI
MLWVSEDAGWRRREAHAVGYGELGRALLDPQAATDQVFDAVTAQAAYRFRGNAAWLNLPDNAASRGLLHASVDAKL